MTTVLALLAMAALLGIFLHSISITVAEIIYGEVDGDGPAPGSEKFPIIAGGAILAYLIIGQMVIS